MAKLNTTIHINDPRGSFVFGPDDELPEWAYKKLKQDGTHQELVATGRPGIFADESAPNPSEGPSHLLEENERLKAELEALKASAAEGTKDPQATDDYDTLDYEELKALVKERELKPASQSKVDLIEALRAEGQ